MDKHYIRSVWEKFLEVQEKKNGKLDPVGKEDGDIDNDGDKDSSDEYLAKKRAAIGKAMKKEEVEEDKSQFMYAAKQAKKKGDQEFVFAGKKYKTEDAYNMKEEDYPVPPKTKKPGDALEPVNNRTAKLKEDETDKPYPTPKKVKKAGDELEDVKNRTAKLKEEEGPYPTPKKVKKPGDALEPVNNRTAKLKEEEKVECPKCEGKGCDHCDDKGYHMKESTQIDEISRDTVGRALEQRVAQLKKNKEQDTKTWDQIVAAQKKGDKRSYDRLMKDANKLENEREKLRKSIQKLSNDINFNPNRESLDTSLFSARELEALGERMETAGATAPEGLMDKESVGSKKFANDHKKSNAKFENIPAQAAADASKSGKATKQSPARSGSDKLGNGDPKNPGFKNPGQK